MGGISLSLSPKGLRGQWSFDKVNVDKKEEKIGMKNDLSFLPWKYNVNEKIKGLFISVLLLLLFAIYGPKARWFSQKKFIFDQSF